MSSPLSFLFLLRLPTYPPLFLSIYRLLYMYTNTGYILIVNKVQYSYFSISSTSSTRQVLNKDINMRYQLVLLYLVHLSICPIAKLPNDIPELVWVVEADIVKVLFLFSRRSTFENISELRDQRHCFFVLWSHYTALTKTWKIMKICISNNFI